MFVDILFNVSIFFKFQVSFAVVRIYLILFQSKQ